MQYPHDGGISAIRYFLQDATTDVARAAAAAISVECCDVGDLICQCTARDQWLLRVARGWALLSCTCNGSSLPLYIGRPPRMDLAEATIVRCESCGGPDHAVAIAIGYAGHVPELGGIDAERAQEIVVALDCRACAHQHIGWRFRLSAPYALRGDEDWLRAIQGRFR